jgi:cephalosporin hydroxylase
VAALKRRPAEVQFELDKSVKEESTGRQLGLIVLSVALKEYEQTAEYHDAQTWLARQEMKSANAESVAQISPARQMELRKLFENLPVWKDLKYQNVQIGGSPLDLWMIQQITGEVRPDVIIETGTSHGGEALYLANALNGLGLEHSRVLTVDRQDSHLEAAAFPLWRKHVEFFQGESTDAAVVARLTQRAQGRKVLVILASDPTPDHVLAELRAYAPLVSHDSYMVVQNTGMDRFPSQSPTGTGPYSAVWRFLQEDAGKNFEQDASREMMVLTRNPGGWLRRK